MFLGGRKEYTTTNFTTEELDFLTLLKQQLNEKEYAFLIRRTLNKRETLAKSAKKIGIKEDYARKIASRMRKKIGVLLGVVVRKCK